MRRSIPASAQRALVLTLGGRVCALALPELPIGSSAGKDNEPGRFLNVCNYLSYESELIRSLFERQL